eukprot:403339113
MSQDIRNINMIDQSQDQNPIPQQQTDQNPFTKFQNQFKQDPPKQVGLHLNEDKSEFIEDLLERLNISMKSKMYSTLDCMATIQNSHHIYSSNNLKHFTQNEQQIIEERNQYMEMYKQNVFSLSINAEFVDFIINSMQDKQRNQLIVDGDEGQGVLGKNQNNYLQMMLQQADIREMFTFEKNQKSLIDQIEQLMQIDKKIQQNNQIIQKKLQQVREIKERNDLLYISKTIN